MKPMNGGAKICITYVIMIHAGEIVKKSSSALFR